MFARAYLTSELSQITEEWADECKTQMRSYEPISLNQVEPAVLNLAVKVNSELDTYYTFEKPKGVYFE